MQLFEKNIFRKISEINHTTGGKSPLSYIKLLNIILHFIWYPYLSKHEKNLNNIKNQKPKRMTYYSKTKKKKRTA